MSTTFPFLVLALIALLPGALFVYTVEAFLGRYGGGVADRTMRFIAASALLWLPFFWLLYAFYRNVWHVGRTVGNRTRYVNLVTTNDLPGWAYWAVAGYIAAPILLGLITFLVIRKWPKAQNIVVGQAPEATTWQEMFKHGGNLVVRARLKDEDGTLVAGYFGSRSMVPSGGAEGLDLWLEAQVRLDADGDFDLDGDDNLDIFQPGIYLKREDILWLEAYEAGGG